MLSADGAPFRHDTSCALAAQSRCRCGRDEPSPGADVGGMSPVPVQMRQGRAQSRCRCGRGEPSPGADVAGVGPIPVQMWQRWHVALQAETSRTVMNEMRAAMPTCQDGPLWHTAAPVEG
jgi:hypothetical protein